MEFSLCFLSARAKLPSLSYLLPKLYLLRANSREGKELSFSLLTGQGE